jgi:hypothetical protein
MRLRWGLYLAILAAPLVRGSTIDVSSETNVVVQTGDTLVFELLTWNFGVNATAFGLSPYPTAVNFDLVSVPLSVTGGVAATLESADQTLSIAFDPLTFGPGYIEGSGYTGAVSTVQGYLPLSPFLSQALFSSGSAFIALRNNGPDVTVGLPSYALPQDVYASLTGGPLSVGALPGSVNLESQGNRVTLFGWGGVADSVPEPRSGGLLLGGGALLCGLSVLLARASRGRG